jgi:hypothetical protein
VARLQITDRAAHSRPNIDLGIERGKEGSRFPLVEVADAEEESELPDYPKDPQFKKMFGPRGVLHCLADGEGGQEITDTGPLTKKRMETIDEEITERALAWMEK